MNLQKNKCSYEEQCENEAFKNRNNDLYCHKHNTLNLLEELEEEGQVFHCGNCYQQIQEEKKKLKVGHYIGIGFLVHEKNPIISSLELKEEVISQKQKTPPNSIENNQCANCQKDICKKGEGSATKYFITLDGREIYENKHWCSNCLPVVKSLLVRKYCRDNGIDRLEYDEKTGKLLVIYKTNKPIEEKEALTEELERIREYVKKKGRTKDSVIAGGIGLFAIVLIAVIGLVRKGVKLVERLAKKNRRGDTYYVLNVNVKRTATERILELRNEERVPVGSGTPFYVFTNIENNEDYYRVSKKPEELDEEEEISNEELLKELERRKQEGRISLNISAVSNEETSVADLDVDLKDNESNCRIILKDQNEEK
ncbi:17524_t:CDS:2 [Funneliformis geosporum]|nr:17524_t:CDS:2 [Funneliformis geosporum]